jgi:hypothetical protein
MQEMPIFLKSFEDFIISLTKQQQPLTFLVVKKNKTMFNFFRKDPIKKLEKQYQQLLEEAMQLQRKGDIKAYARKMDEAEQLLKTIEEQKKS